MLIKLNLTQEYNFIDLHMPHYLQNQCRANIAHHLPEHFTETLYGPQSAPNLNLIATPIDIGDLFPERDDLAAVTFIGPEKDLLGWDYSIPQINISGLITEFGRDAFGMYLPFHNYRECWGIYLFKDNIQSRVSELHQIFGDKIRRNTLLRMYEYAVYRHELFHYQVERFATKGEIITRSPIYGPSRRLNAEFKGTADWLEEALAESAVVRSTLVPKRTELEASLVKEIYERDLQDMPPGYKDYKCEKYKGEKNAHLHFATQIIMNILKPDKRDYITDFVSIKDEFIALDKKVPTYMVTGFANVKPVNL